MQNTKSRQYQLFKLLASQDSYKPASYFKNLLSVSLKTVYNDLEQLIEEMKPYELTLSKIPRNGLKLVGAAEHIEAFQKYLMGNNEEVDMAYSPMNRRMRIMKYVLLEDQAPSLEELEQSFYVTSASLRADLAYLQDYVKPFHVNIYTAKGRIYIRGNESSLQKSYKSLLMNSIKDSQYDAVINLDPLDHLTQEYFKPNILEIANHMIRYLADITNLSISEYYASSLYLTTLILMSRISNGHHIAETEKVSEDISYMEPYMIAFELAENAEKKSGLQFSEEDICYMSEQLFAHRVESNNSNMVINEEFRGIVDEMIMKMSKILEVDLQDDEKLRNSLLSHVPAMIYRMKRKIKITNPLLAEIKKQYIVLFSLTWYVACDLEQHYNVVLDDDEISFLFIYFQVSLEKRHGVHFKNIVIVCPIGMAMSELVFTKVRQILPNRDNIMTMSAKQLYQSDLSNVDFVISTMKLTNIKQPVIYVSPLMSDDDMERITQVYSKLNKQRSTLQQIANTHTLEINHYLQERFIYCNKQFKDKDECLKFLIQHYEQANIVTDAFARSVYEREEMGDTSVYTGVAMPHALPETVKQTQIGIVTLKEKIRWGVNDVKVVILIAIAEKDIDRIGEMLSRLLMIVESPKVIEEMLSTRSRGALAHLLKETLKEPNT